LCPDECPANAIFPQDEVPEGQQGFIALNAELAKAWPTIDARKTPPPDADQWKGVEGKLKHLERE